MENVCQMTNVIMSIVKVAERSNSSLRKSSYGALYFVIAKRNVITNLPKTDFLLRDKARFAPALSAGNLDKIFSIQNDEGWVNQCANATFAPLADDDFDYVFTTSEDNSCYHLKQKRINGDIKLSAQYVLSGANAHPGSPIIFGRKIKFDFDCPMGGGNLVNKSNVDKIKSSGIRQQMMFVGAIFAMMLVFAAIHIYVQKRHRDEMLLLKNKVY